MLNKIFFLTAGESHGKGLLGIIEGIPAGLNIQEEYILGCTDQQACNYNISANFNLFIT